MRHQFQHRNNTMALYSKEISLQSGLSAHKPILRVWNDYVMSCFRRDDTIFQMDWVDSGSRRLFLNNEMILIWISQQQN